MIIAIDPGTKRSAYCCLLNGKVSCYGTEENLKVLRMIRGPMSDWYAGSDTLAIEQIASMGMSVGQEIFDTVQWVGRFQEAWENRGGTCLMVRRIAVKMHLCGNVRAKDANIRTACIDQFGGKEAAIGKKKYPGPLFGIKADEWSALAIGLTAAAKLEENTK